MPVRIRLSRVGAKKRPIYRIVVADSRRSRDGKFIDRIGTYNPMLSKENPERIKIDSEKAKEWIQKGAQPSERVQLFLSNIGLMEKPIITEKTKKHLPRKKSQEKAENEKQALDAEQNKDKPAEDKKEAKAEDKPAEDKPAEDKKEAKAEDKPAENKKEAKAEDKPAENKKEASVLKEKNNS